jgi:hypothetical protein
LTAAESRTVQLELMKVQQERVRHQLGLASLHRAYKHWPMQQQRLLWTAQRLRRVTPQLLLRQALWGTH